MNEFSISYNNTPCTCIHQSPYHIDCYSWALRYSCMGRKRVTPTRLTNTESTMKTMNMQRPKDVGPRCMLGDLSLKSYQKSKRKAKTNKKEALASTKLEYVLAAAICSYLALILTVCSLILISTNTLISKAGFPVYRTLSSILTWTILLATGALTSRAN